MSLARELKEGRWGLGRSKALARRIETDPAEVRALVKTIFGDDVELRKRAADVARRITEVGAEPLRRYADEFAGLLAELPVGESRTRWHLGLVVPRVAGTREQRLRAARLMMLMEGDESNVVRCSAVEGLGTLALVEGSLRGEAEGMVERFLWGGTLAMKSRARHVRRVLVLRYGMQE